MEATAARAGGAESESLKAIFLPEIVTVKSTEKAFSEDEFFVDGLLDFSNEDEFIKEKKEEEEEKDVSCISSSVEETQNSNSSVSVRDDFGAVLGSGLDVPADDLADLEWLSHFVDDSFSEFPSSNDSFLCKPEPETETQKRYKPEPKTKADIVFWKPAVFGLETHVPAKARSKRPRITGPGRVWSYGAPRFTESSPSSSSSSSSSSSLSFSSCLMVPKPGPTWDLVYSLGKPPPSKKPNRGRKPAAENSQQPQRRCTHCLVQKTPQWRTGPLGPKTLCNACGVRFKSGRLLPEYRPAGSPTFSSDVHSNSHRKVLEMRRKKEVSVPPELSLPAAVQSF